MLCCPVDWSNHAAFKWSQFGTVVLATFSSKLSPSLVSQGHPDFGSLEVIVGHFIHFALIPKRIWSYIISIWLCCPVTSASYNNNRASSVPQCFIVTKHFHAPPFVKVTSLRECQLPHVLLWKPAGGRTLGEMGHWTNARVTLWVCWLVGLECQCVGPSLVSGLASREVPIQDICQEWDVRDASTRRSGWCLPRIHTGSVLERQKWRTLAWIGLERGPWILPADDCRNI